MDTELPKRIQLSRKKGWRMPENTVSVARPTIWGNPWTVAAYRDAGYNGSDEQAAAHCVDAFRAWMKGEEHWAHGCNQSSPPDPSGLVGLNLACWCKPGLPCHANVLLELANPRLSALSTQEGAG